MGEITYQLHSERLENTYGTVEEAMLEALKLVSSDDVAYIYENHLDETGKCVNEVLLTTMNVKQKPLKERFRVGQKVICNKILGLPECDGATGLIVDIVSNVAEVTVEQGDEDEFSVIVFLTDLEEV
ncbi:hypothetical protein HCA33_05320 [Listeria seeligeri]|nr:hypothetical protein [Listeria seeligeri]MBC1879433.1 hypothetical protein [Listeria seeligeri]MBC6160735.1 hypothetical protein [Listeria seeligeri]